jgi:hypothetical protein
MILGPAVWGHFWGGVFGGVVFLKLPEWRCVRAVIVVLVICFSLMLVIRVRSKVSPVRCSEWFLGFEFCGICAENAPDRARTAAADPAASESAAVELAEQIGAVEGPERIGAGEQAGITVAIGDQGNSNIGNSDNSDNIATIRRTDSVASTRDVRLVATG